LPVLSRLRILYLLQFSQPHNDRVILRAIHKQGVRRILELGMGSGDRAMRLIELAQASAGEDAIRYIGIDPFEGRPDWQRCLTIKSTYRTLRSTGAVVRLLPGNPQTVLAQFANSLGPVDLAIVSAGYDPLLLARMWFYVPRMLPPQSLVYLEEVAPGGAITTRLVSLDEINALADRAMLSRRAA